MPNNIQPLLRIKGAPKSALLNRLAQTYTLPLLSYWSRMVIPADAYAK